MIEASAPRLKDPENERPRPTAKPEKSVSGPSTSKSESKSVRPRLGALLAERLILLLSSSMSLAALLLDLTAVADLKVGLAS